MAETLTRGLPGRHARFTQTAIGEVPQSWSIVPISEVVRSCDYGISSALSVDTTGVAVLRMSNMKDGVIVLDDLKYAPQAKISPSLMLATGDVLFNRTNSKDLVGKVGLFPGSDQAVAFASYLLRLRVNPDRATGPWLSAVMNTEQNQRRLRSIATPGVSQVNINRVKMLAIQVPLPTLSEQEEIVSVLDANAARLAQERLYLVGLVNLKSALMAVLLTGELRVTPDKATP